MGRVDYLNIGSGGCYNNSTPGKLLRSYNLFAGTNHAWNYGGDKIWTSFFNQVTFNFTNLWSLYAGGEYDPSAIDDRLTRGGPRGRQPTQWGCGPRSRVISGKPFRISVFRLLRRHDKGYAKDLSWASTSGRARRYM